MVKALKISAIVLTAAFATGCTSTSKALEDLQSQVDGLNAKIATASSDAASAQASAAEAAARASAAEAAANRAAQFAQDTNSKLDRVFKKSMMK
jgi:murein lipoprotein